MIQLLVWWMQIADKSSPNYSGRDQPGVNSLFMFAALKTAVFLAALVAFVTGLISVRLRDADSDTGAAGRTHRQDPPGG